MSSDEFLENIEEYIILRRDDYTLQQIDECDQLKDFIYSEDPYGIGDRPLYDVEKISLQDVVDRLITSDPNHMVYNDLVFFYRNASILKCTDRKEYIILGLFEAYIELMRMRLQDTLGIPEILYTMFKEKDEYVYEEWQEVVKIAVDFKEVMDDVNLQVQERKEVDDCKRSDVLPGCSNDKILKLVESVRSDSVLEVVQQIQYYDSCSEIMINGNYVVRKHDHISWRSLFDVNFSGGEMPLAPWLVFHSMKYEQLKLIPTVSKEVYRLYLVAMRGTSFAGSLYFDYSPPRCFCGGVVSCTEHELLFCNANRHMRVSTVSDIRNSVYTMDEFDILRRLCYTLPRDQYRFLFSLLQGRNEYECVAIVLVTLYTLLEDRSRKNILEIKNKYRLFYRLGIVMSKFSIPSTFSLRMIDNESREKLVFRMFRGKPLGCNRPRKRIFPRSEGSVADRFNYDKMTGEHSVRFGQVVDFKRVIWIDPPVALM